MQNAKDKCNMGILRKCVIVSTMLKTTVHVVTSYRRIVSFEETENTVDMCQMKSNYSCHLTVISKYNSGLKTEGS